MVISIQCGDVEYVEGNVRGRDKDGGRTLKRHVAAAYPRGFTAVHRRRD